jgi:4-diphosphocytidyl-2-C-methyl-D-erythritol kinase
MSRVLQPVQVRALAKINVTLRVLGIRPDDYHELRTVLQSVALHDRLIFEPTRGAFEIASDDPACPVDRTNLVWRAAALVWRAAGRRGVPRGVRVTIQKRIPIQAGLGGGSSDAAAALRVLSEWWAPGIESTQLHRAAGALGADVPFFLLGGAALGVERGDRLFSLADSPPAWVVLAQPDFGVSTADAYRWFDARMRASNGDRWRNRRSSQPGGPYSDGGNDLQPAVQERHPVIARLISALRRRGAVWAAMSGSGSAVFGLFEEEHTARRAADLLRGPRCLTLTTRTVSARQYRRLSAPRGRESTAGMKSPPAPSPRPPAR